MATVKVKFRPSTVKDHPGSIIYLVTHRRVVRQITTGYKIHPSEWDERRAAVIVTDNDRLRMIAQRIRWDMERLYKIINSSRICNPDCTTDELVRTFVETAQENLFFQFMRKVILQLKRLNKERTAENYTAALNSFMRFRNGNDIPLGVIDSDLMMEYEAGLKSQGISMNTISFYNRILRAVYNRAVEKELTPQRNPFKHVYTGVDKTVKRAVSLKVIRQIRDLDLSLHPALDFARDMFMFSFYTRGMSFIDMAYLKKADLQNGVLSYRRRKTGQQLFIKWEKPMQEIIEKYETSDTPYLFPVIRDSEDKQRIYRNALRLVNNKLKKISELIGLQANLTMYVSRHSWGSIAKSQNVPLSVISEGLGHDSESTTQIYLASLDSSVVDKANELILGKLSQKR